VSKQNYDIPTDPSQKIPEAWRKLLQDVEAGDTHALVFLAEFLAKQPGREAEKFFNIAIERGELGALVNLARLLPSRREERETRRPICYGR
jgi:hypothetical protein